MGFVALFYMMFVHDMRPKFKSMFKSYGALTVLGIIAMIANSMIPGANYLFLASTEETESVLNLLPSNYALKVTLMAILIGVLFFVAYLPWFIKDRKTENKEIEKEVCQ
jgi:uncharacterized membrane protein YwaF